MRWGQPVTGCPFVNAPWSVYEIRVIDMENSLYIYHMVVPLRYYTYDLHSEKKDSEYVIVFCKPFLHKIAKSFCRLLHLHFVGNCKTTAGSYSASHKPLQIIFSCYNTRYGNGSSEFSSSCACSLK